MGIVTGFIPVKYGRTVEGLSITWNEWFRDALSSKRRQEDFSVIVKLGRSINTDSGQYAILSSSPAATVKAVQEDHSLKGSMSQENPVSSLSWIDQGEKLCLDILELQIEEKYNIRDQVVWKVWFKIYDFGKYTLRTQKKKRDEGCVISGKTEVAFMMWFDSPGKLSGSESLSKLLSGILALMIPFLA